MYIGRIKNHIQLKKFKKIKKFVKSDTIVLTLCLELTASLNHYRLLFSISLYESLVIPNI